MELKGMPLGFLTLEIYKSIGFPLVSPAASCILDLTQGEKSAHCNDIFSYLHPNCAHYMQQSYNKKCAGELMKAELWITSVFYGTCFGHCPRTAVTYTTPNMKLSDSIITSDFITSIAITISDSRSAWLYQILFYSSIHFLMYTILQ